MTPAVSAVAALHAWAEDIRRTALEDVRWETLSPADQRRVDALTRAIVDGVLREPTARAHAQAEREVVEGLYMHFPLDVPAER